MEGIPKLDNAENNDLEKESNEKIRIDFVNRVNSLFDALSEEKDSLKIEHADDIGLSKGSLNGRIYNMVVSDKNRFSKVSESTVLNSIALILKESGLRVYGEGGRIYVVSEGGGFLKKKLNFHELYSEEGMGHLPVPPSTESGKMFIYSNGLISSMEPYLKNDELYLRSQNQARNDLKIDEFSLSVDDLKKS